jgi:hypothetical protein
VTSKNNAQGSPAGSKKMAMTLNPSSPFLLTVAGNDVDKYL